MEPEKRSLKPRFNSEIHDLNQDKQNEVVENLLASRQMLDDLIKMDAKKRLKVLSAFSLRNNIRE
ncbi:hypothetical protein GF351_02500 [Candidatus Woesearchaeota archaeon]|nr:hypothetical protein [Candidatus Woesearchaeota archaeon]